MSCLPPRDIISLKVSLPVAQEAGKPFDPPLLVSAIGTSFPVNSDDLYLARISLDKVGDIAITRSKDRTEMVLEGELEAGLTTELDGMLFFLFDRKMERTLKPLQLGAWTIGQRYRFSIQIFACRLNRHPLNDYWGAKELVGEVLTHEIASIGHSSIRANPDMLVPDRQLSEAIAGMRITNPSTDLAEMKKRHPTRDQHDDATKGPWRTLARGA
ncbi:hypothetical protein TOPH_00609 [Tolypocladium ophioglossoides CBS 100239]|uniref:Uncharacterized protein n=1 Tax=Tolypocladium ophioglossoides (strain CBS 100239) TaxID=1163406 RepID=A0A0L0NM75_TOLOC|nr:hypothetical protein TOPH_00609 [Tolypocladium ophioglossoides CBS 100239]